MLSQRAGDAVAIVRRKMAPRDIGAWKHSVDAHRQIRIYHLVDVDRDALCLVGSERRLDGLEVAVLRPSL